MVTMYELSLLLKMIPLQGVSLETATSYAVNGQISVKTYSHPVSPVVSSSFVMRQLRSVSNAKFFARITKEARYNRILGAIMSRGYINYSQLRLALNDINVVFLLSSRFCHGNVTKVGIIND